MDGEQGRGETLCSRRMQRQADFEHITQNGNNEAEDEGFCIDGYPSVNVNCATGNKWGP